MTNKILCPIDFSDTSEAALKFALTLARDNFAEVHLVHVLEPGMPYGGGHTMYIVDAEDREEILQKMRELHADDTETTCLHHLVDGDPARVIVDFAKKEGCDLIVIGTHGRTGLARLLMGSVAESVVRRAHCPVLALRQPANVADKADASS